MKVKCLTEFVTQMIKVNIIITFDMSYYYELILFELPFNSQLVFKELFLTSHKIASRPPVSIYNAWHGDPWVNAGFVHDRRGTSSNVRILIFMTYAASCASLANKSFSVRFRPLWNTCSHSPRDFPGNRQLTYFRRLSTNNLLLVKLCDCVIIPKSGPSCAQSVN